MAIQMEASGFTKQLLELEGAISSNKSPPTSTTYPKPDPIDLSPIDIGLCRRNILNGLPPTSPISPMTPGDCEDIDFGKGARKELGGFDRCFARVMSPMESVCGENGEDKNDDGDLMEMLIGDKREDVSRVVKREDAEDCLERLVLYPSIGFCGKGVEEKEKIEWASMDGVRKQERDLAFLLGECDSLINVGDRKELEGGKCCSTTSTCTASTVSGPRLGNGSCGEEMEEVRGVKQEVGDGFGFGIEMDIDEEKLKENSYRIFSARADQKVGLRKKSRTYSKAVASRFCHICTRQRKTPTSHAECHNVKYGTCRKSVCERCFIKYKWDWEAVRAPGALWLCPHCCNVCPTSAQCYNYEKSFQKRNRKIPESLMEKLSQIKAEKEMQE